LVFLDDDILVEPDYLFHLMQPHEAARNRIVVGKWDFGFPERTPFTQFIAHMLTSSVEARPVVEAQSTRHASADMRSLEQVSFRDVSSNNMSLRREAYFVIGLMQGLGFAGSSMWCDLDFTYRAHRLGFEFVRSTRALCLHRDHAARNLDDYKRRMRTAAYRGAALFKKYPELIAQVPIFHDKTPIHWGQDPAGLIARKMTRLITSSRLFLWSMEQVVRGLEMHHPTSGLLPALYRCIIGGYIFQGYRDGLREYTRMGAQ
jgi:hypothetical protein